MYNKDILFAANAESVEITKFLQFVSAVALTTSDVAGAGNNIEIWRIDSRLR
jgi:polysaccharide export outer membrane protein